MAQNAGSGEEPSFQEFIEEALVLYERTQDELKEIEVLVKQSAAEVERLAQRNAQVNNYLRQLHASFETVPRQDIKEGYEALSNAQQRLFTMRGQLEKLQSDQRNLQRLAEFQKELLDVTGGLSQMPSVRFGERDQSTVIRVIQTEEAARQSLVRRMHDGPASSLSNFILQAEICQRFFDSDPERARIELDALKSSAASTFNAVKNFIFDLRPMMLDDLGVVPTIRRYIETFQEQSGTSVSVAVTGTERRLEDHIETTIFRAVQELLNNAWMHGRAGQIQVLFDLDLERVLAVVEDDGSGFNIKEAFDESARKIGLSTLRERIEMLGGELTIESSPGKGARAEIVIPVASPEVEDQPDSGPL